MANTSSTIGIKLQGIDNASKAIADVTNKLNGLNKTVADGGKAATSAGQAVSAASSIASGSVVGLASGFRQLMNVIKQVGGASGPLGIAVAAA